MTLIELLFTGPEVVLMSLLQGKKVRMREPHKLSCEMGQSHIEEM